MSLKYSNITEHCTFLRGLTYKKTDEVAFSNNAILRSNNVNVITNKLVFDEIKYINDKILINESKKVKKDSLLICTANGSKSHLGKVALIENEINYAFGGFMGLIIPNENLTGKFLYYNLIAPRYKKFIESLSDGANINNLKFSQFNDFQIPVPSLPEQQAIVEKLDFAFDAIEKAKANIEKNIENAKELFQSKLNEIINLNENDKKLLGDISQIKTGKLNSNAMIEGGLYNFFTCSREIYKINNYAFDCEAVLLAGNNASGDFNVKHFEGKFNAYQRTYVITSNSKILNLKLLKYILEEYLANFKKMSIGANTKFLKIDMIKNVEIGLPNIMEQEKIVNHLDKISLQTKLLEEKYKQKLANLEELKKSILEKAFKGELV